MTFRNVNFSSNLSQNFLHHFFILDQTTPMLSLQYEDLSAIPADRLSPKWHMSSSHSLSEHHSFFIIWFIIRMNGNNFVNKSLGKLCTQEYAMSYYTRISLYTTMKTKSKKHKGWICFDRRWKLYFATRFKLHDTFCFLFIHFPTERTFIDPSSQPGSVQNKSSFLSLGCPKPLIPLWPRVLYCK